MTTSQPELLRVNEAAALLSISRSKAYEMIEKGELPVVRLGTCIRIPRKRLMEWIEEQTTLGMAA